MAESSQASASPPEEGRQSDHHKYIWGGVIIAVFAVLVGVSLFFFFWRKLLPILRQRWTQRGELIKLVDYHNLYIAHPLID